MEDEKSKNSWYETPKDWDENSEKLEWEKGVRTVEVD